MRFVVGLMVGVCLLGPVWAEPPMYRCARTAAPVTIDGVVDGEWDAAETIALNAGAFYMRTTVPPRSNEDISCVAKLMYDQTHLYMAFAVTDDVFNQTFGPTDSWRGDGVQIAISSDGKTNYWEACLALCGGEPSCVWYVAGMSHDVQALTAATVCRIGQSGDVTTYEAAIPWDQLSPISGSSESFRFSFIVNEQDEGIREGWLEWARPSGIGLTKAPDEYGIVRLERPELPEGSPVQGALNLDRTVYTDDDEVQMTLSVGSGMAGDGRITWTLRREGDGAAAFEKAQNVSLERRMKDVAFSWPTGDVPGGDYVLTVAVAQGNLPAVELTARFVKLHAGDIREKAARIVEARDRLAERIKQCGDRSIPAPYLTAVRNLADHFLPWIEHDLTIRERHYNPIPDTMPPAEPERIVGPVKVLFWNRANENADYVLAELTKALDEVERLLADPSRAKVVRQLDLETLTASGGCFRDRHGPVFLVGSLFGARGQTADELKVIADYGFNWWNLANLPNVKDITDGVPPEQWADGFMRYASAPAAYRRATELSIAVYGLFHWWGTTTTGPERHDPGCAAGFAFDLDDPAHREVLSRYFQTVGRELRQFPAQTNYMLFNEVTYGYCWCSRGEARFREAMRDRFGTIDALNAAWSTDYTSFEAITAPRDRSVSQGLWYEYNRENLRRLPEILGWCADQIRKTDGRSWIHSKVMNPLLDSHDYCMSGVDREGLGRVLDLFEYDTVLRPNAGSPALTLWRGVPQYDLQRSMKPDVPGVETEFHTIPLGHWGHMDGDYIKACYWLGATHGVGGFLQWIWWRDGYNAANANGIDEHANRVHACSTAALDLRRLAEYVAAVATEKGEVAILYSRTAMIHRPGQWNMLLPPYQGLYWLNTPPIDFVTEDQIRAGKLSGYKLLVVHGSPWIDPDTLDVIRRFVRDGGRLVLTADSATQDPYGRELDTADLVADRAADGRSSFGKGAVHYVANYLSDVAWMNYFDALIDEVGVKRGALRLRDGNGGPAAGVEVREAEVAGQRVVYLMNFNAEPVEVSFGRIFGQPLVELVEGTPLAGATLSLKPLVPHLITAR